MATVVQTVDLSLTDFLVPPVVHIKQYDTAARKIVCNLYIESTQFSVPSGYVADIAAIKPDGETFQYNSKSNADVIQISNGAVEITITEAMSAVPGIIPVDVTLADASGLAGCFAFVLDVQKTAARSEITASDVADVEDNEDDSEITTSAKIYGVSWDKSSNTKLIRTDDAAGFSDPVPAIGGTGGSSPFDYILP